jgi:multidrug efflux pump subunit AcrA (membrane-fusion protein)
VEHPEETDFDALQKRMDAADAKLEERIALAQAYVWTYPASPHQSDAEQYLQQMEKKLADRQQAEKDAEAARVAARAKLVQRAQARDLSLSEWRDFLRDMSQDDLVKFLGRPTSQRDDYWIYSGAWIIDPASKQKVGMEINFNAGRVIGVVEEPRSQ